jgi:hypothetical protein
MSNFINEDGFKINNKYFPAISYLSTETISRPSQSHETIPLTNGLDLVIPQAIMQCRVR